MLWTSANFRFFEGKRGEIFVQPHIRRTFCTRCALPTECKTRRERLNMEIGCKRFYWCSRAPQPISVARNCSWLSPVWALRKRNNPKLLPTFCNCFGTWTKYSYPLQLQNGWQFTTVTVHVQALNVSCVSLTASYRSAHVSCLSRT